MDPSLLPQELREKALERIRAEAFEEALDLADRLAVLEPEGSSAPVLRGIALSQLGRADEAEEAFAESLRREPENHRALYNLAVHHARAGNVDRAAELARRALAADPYHQPTHELIAWAREAGCAASESTPSRDARAPLEGGDGGPEASDELTPPPAADRDAELWPPVVGNRFEPPRPTVPAPPVVGHKTTLGPAWQVFGWVLAVLGFVLQIVTYLPMLALAREVAGEDKDASFSEVFARAQTMADRVPEWATFGIMGLIFLAFVSFAYVAIDVRERRGSIGWSVALGLCALASCLCGCGSWLALPAYLLFGRRK